MPREMTAVASDGGEVRGDPFFSDGWNHMQRATHWARFVGELCGSKLVSFFGRVRAQAGTRQKHAKTNHQTYPDLVCKAAEAS